MNIYVGNIAPGVTEDDLMPLFAEHGKVKVIKVLKDMMTGENRGFGFVEMMSAEEGKKAIQAVNAKELKGKKLVVNEARPKTEGGGGNRGGNRGGGGRGFGGGYSGRGR